MVLFLCCVVFNGIVLMELLCLVMCLSLGFVSFNRFVLLVDLEINGFMEFLIVFILFGFIGLFIIFGDISIWLVGFFIGVFLFFVGFFLLNVELIFGVLIFGVVIEWIVFCGDWFLFSLMLGLFGEIFVLVGVFLCRVFFRSVLLKFRIWDRLLEDFVGFWFLNGRFCIWLRMFVGERLFFVLEFKIDVLFKRIDVIVLIFEVWFGIGLFFGFKLELVGGMIFWFIGLIFGLGNCFGFNGDWF